MELKDYLNVLRARKWVILQAVVITTLAAIVAAVLQPKSYRGEAKVLISETDTGAAIFGALLPAMSSQPERGLQTQVQLMQLRPLAESVVRKLELRTSPTSVLDRIEVEAVAQTNIVTVRATSGEPQEAAAIANAMAEEFVEWSRASKRESLEAAATEVEARLDAAKQEVLELGRRVADEGKSDDLAAELQIATGGYSTLAEKLEQLRINEQLEAGSGRIVSLAVVDPAPVAPQPRRDGLLGMAVGLVLGIGVAFLYEYLDDSVKSQDELERILEVPVVGYIVGERVQKEEERCLAIVDHPGSRVAESYRVLRNSLEFINFQRDLKTLLITSAAPGEGKSTVAANLAAALAQTGEKVVLLSCDFRRPTTEQFFGVTNMIGLSDVLTGSHTLKAALQRPGDEQLVILTSGKMPPNPSELLGSRKMQELVNEVEQWADWVIIDSPPLLAVADTAAVARWAHGVMVVARAGASTRHELVKAKEMLANVGARVVGSVMWDIGDNASADSYRARGHYGNYYYADYCETPDSTRRSSRFDSGAKSPVKVAAKKTGVEPRSAYLPVKSPGRRIVEGAMRVAAAVLGFVAVVAVSSAVAYSLDTYLGWGLIERLVGLL